VYRICKVDPSKCLFFGRSFNNLVHEVRTFGTDARRFRMVFQPKSSRADRTLDARQRVADLTRDVFANQLHKADVVLFALHLMLSIYKEQEAQDPRETNDRRESAPSTTRYTLTASTRPLLDPRANRHHGNGSNSDEILYVSSKRRKRLLSLHDRSAHMMVNVLLGLANLPWRSTSAAPLSFWTGVEEVKLHLLLRKTLTSQKTICIMQLLSRRLEKRPL